MKERLNDGLDPATKTYVTGDNYHLDALAQYSKTTLVRIATDQHKMLEELKEENADLKKRIQNVVSSLSNQIEVVTAANA